jgi:superfamily II DNA or RNA helicase
MLRPWPHQAQALRDLLLGHAALWWEPGAGKTLPLALAGAEAGGRQLWITLGMLREQAARDIQAARGRCSVQIIRSQSDTVDPDTDVVIVSYDLIRSAPIWRQAFGLRWSSMVCDEAHALKEGRSLRTRAVYGATRVTNFRPAIPL